MSNSKKKLLMLVILLVGCVLTSLIAKLTGERTVVVQSINQKKGMKLNNTASGNVKPKGRLIKVYISGAVLLPGIYELPGDARAQDAVRAAGGMLEIADQDKVNLAKLLKDGMQVNVPYQKGKRIKIAGTDVELKTKNIYPDEYNHKPAAKQVVFPVNVNTATQEELEAIPGIGPTMAVRIIAQRTSLPFRRVEELLRVQGIGKSKLEKLRAYVCVK